MKKLIVLALFLAGCSSGAQFKTVCNKSPLPPSYPTPIVDCDCPGDKFVVVKKTFFGLKTYEMTDYSKCVRTYKIKRIKGQD